MFACKNVFVQGGGLGSEPEWSHRLLLDCPTSIPQHFPLPVSFEVRVYVIAHMHSPSPARVAAPFFIQAPILV